MTEAESYINCVTQYNWSDAYAGLNTDVKGILKMTASALSAMAVINYDIRNFPSVRSAELALDVLNEQVNKGIQQLKENAIRQFVEDA